ncbi:hypothetical protein [Flavobacterium faecale]|uniref:hypothetical protein n=1 Tax=Flavobacterium faecale TaxID=1355330 RepID=UPI00131F2A85|nr:hypothetical protein [Flavobacterium faecale]
MNAQKVLAFLGAGQNINTSFDNNGYLNLSTGVQYNLEGFIKPEIEMRFFFGSLQNNTTYDIIDPSLRSKDVFTNLQAFNWSITPNFSVSIDEDDYWYLAVKPKYNYAEIKATDRVILYQGSKIIRSEEIRKGVSRSFGLNLGVIGKLWSESFDSILLSVFMDNINFNKVVKKTKEIDVDTKYNLGFEVTYYFSFRKKK